MGLRTPYTKTVSSTSKVVALSIALFRFNALTIQRSNEALLFLSGSTIHAAKAIR
jgi:hypothetical protein